jgi:hypothetical protein
MNKHLVTVLTTVIVVVLAGAGALVLAGSVSNRPGPVFISRFEDDTTTTTRPRRAPSISVPTTNDERVAPRSAVGDHQGRPSAPREAAHPAAPPDDSTTPTTIEDRAAGVTSSSTVSVPATVDDHGIDAPTPLDDRGGQGPSGGSGSVSRSSASTPSAP